VEQLQRLHRQRVAARLGQTLDEAANFAIDREHRYNGYIEAIEGLRTELGEPEEGFYRMLLGVELRERPEHIRRLLAQLPGQITRARMLLFMRAHARLSRAPGPTRRKP
jgi:hypothetical protein